jgi:hypothetical protein
VDIRALFKTLSTVVRDHTDDGRVSHAPEPEIDASGAGETSGTANGSGAPETLK